MPLSDMPLQAYGKARLQGSDEIGAVLLSIGSDLLAFNFRETFVNAFDVSPWPTCGQFVVSAGLWCLQAFQNLFAHHKACKYLLTKLML